MGGIDEEVIRSLLAEHRKVREALEEKVEEMRVIVERNKFAEKIAAILQQNHHDHHDPSK